MLYTLTEPVTYQEEIKKSRFLVFAGPVDSPAAALAFLTQGSNPEATHNCWAYRVGSEYRFNDDGEPGGTAGRPILQAIDGQQCDRVAVLVVRWFGGIKLGPGGLIRAYGGSAAQCLRLAQKTALVDEIMADCHCPFADLALVQSRFTAYGARVVDEDFDEHGVRWRLAVPAQQAEELVQTIVNLTRGQAYWKTDTA